MSLIKKLSQFLSVESGFRVVSLALVSPCLQQTLDPVYPVAGPGQAGHDYRERLPLPQKIYVDTKNLDQNYLDRNHLDLYPSLVHKLTKSRKFSKT